MKFLQRNQLLECPLVTFTPVPQGTPGSVTTTTFFNTDVEQTTLTSAYNNWLALVPDYDGAVVTPMTTTPAVLDISGWPVVARVSDGVGQLEINVAGCKQRATLINAGSGGRVSREIIGFTAGTVPAFQAGELTPLMDLGGDMEIISASSYASSLAYNPSCWAAAYDFTGVPVASRSGFLGGGAAITARHVAFAQHYPPSLGSVLKFLKADGTQVSRTIIGLSFEAAHNAVVGDLMVATLDSALPAGIKIYPVAGAWAFETSEVGGVTYRVHAHVGILVNQQRRANLTVLVDEQLFRVHTTTGTLSINGDSIASGPTGFPWQSAFLPGFLSDYSDFSALVLPGDSGSPLFLPVADGGLALASLAATNVGGPFWGNSALVNALIEQADTAAGVATGLTVTVAPDPTL